MANFYPTFRGPQETAQANAQSLPTPNNGNPNGVNNNSGIPSRGIDPAALLALPAHTRRNSDAPGYFNAIHGGMDAGGQHANLGRYAPPTVDSQGRSTQRGPYSYNLPNAYGGTGIMTGMPNWATSSASVFAPEFSNAFDRFASRFNLAGTGEEEENVLDRFRRRMQARAGGINNNRYMDPVLDNAATELERLMQQQKPAESMYNKPVVMPEYSDNILPIIKPGDI